MVDALLQSLQWYWCTATLTPPVPGISDYWETWPNEWGSMFTSWATFWPSCYCCYLTYRVCINRWKKPYQLPLLRRKPSLKHFSASFNTPVISHWPQKPASLDHVLTRTVRRLLSAISVWNLYLRAALGWESVQPWTMWQRAHGGMRLTSPSRLSQQQESPETSEVGSTPHWRSHCKKGVSESHGGAIPSWNWSCWEMKGALNSYT